MDYFRKDASVGAFQQTLANHAEGMSSELAAKAVRYCGPEGKRTQAKVEVLPGYLRARVWLDMGLDSTQAEAQELAEILLGPNAKVGAHVMVKGLWVGVIQVKL